MLLGKGILMGPIEPKICSPQLENTFTQISRKANNISKSGENKIFLSKLENFIRGPKDFRVSNIIYGKHYKIDHHNKSVDHNKKSSLKKKIQFFFNCPFSKFRIKKERHDFFGEEFL